MPQNVKDAIDWRTRAQALNGNACDGLPARWGGPKPSGTDRVKALHAFDKYTELNTTWIDLT